MSKIVEADAAEPGTAAQRVELASDVPRFQRCAACGRKHKIVIGPCSTGRIPLRVLSLLVPTEHADAGSRHGDDPGRAVGFHRAEPKLPVDPLQAGTDPKDPAVKVDVGPAQTEELPFAEPEHERQHVQRVETAAPGRLEEFPCLTGCPRGEVRPIPVVQAKVLRHVLCDKPLEKGIL